MRPVDSAEGGPRSEISETDEEYILGGVVRPYPSSSQISPELANLFQSFRIGNRPYPRVETNASYINLDVNAVGELVFSAHGESQIGSEAETFTVNGFSSLSNRGNVYLEEPQTPDDNGGEELTEDDHDWDSDRDAEYCDGK
jgi:hypothetical protein